MANAGTTIQKQGTKLVETSDEELKKLSEQAGFSPTTPMGAKNIGANPDQAKMAATPARQNAAVTTPAPAQTLQQAQRVTPTQPEAVEPPDQKLERLKSLGSINMQMENLVKQKLATAEAQAPELQINETTVGTALPQQQAGLNTALTQYKGAVTEQQKEAAILAASNALGRLVTPEEMKGFFKGASETVAGQFGSQPSVRVADLGLQNTSQLAQDLGISEADLLQYSPDQLKQAIQNVESQGYNRVQELEAELISATGNRRLQVQQELQKLGQTGVASKEADFDSLQAAVDSGDIVNFNGQKYDVQTLLGDEGISQQILTALENPAAMAQLKKNEPELAAWLDTHKAALAALSEDVRAATADVATTQKDFSSLKSATSPALFEKLFGASPQYLSKEQLSELSTRASSSPLWQALSTDTNLKARLERNPEAVANLKNATAEEIAAQMEATTLMESNPSLQKLIGFKPGGIATAEQAAKAKTWATTFDSLPESITADNDFQKAINAGSIDVADAAKLAADPRIWAKVKENQQIALDLQQAGNDPQKLLSIFMGAEVSLDDFNKGMQKLETYAMMGDSDAQAKWKFFKENLLGDDKKLGPEDLDLLKQLANPSKAGVKAMIADPAHTFADILKTYKKDFQEGASFGSSDPVKEDASTALANDGRIDAKEAKALYDRYSQTGQFEELMNSPWFVNSLENADIWKAKIADTKINQQYEKFSAANGPLSQPIQTLSSLPFLKNFSVDTETGNVTYTFDKARYNETPQRRAEMDAAISKAISTTQAELDKYGTAQNMGIGISAQDKLKTLIKSLQDMQKAVTQGITGAKTVVELKPQEKSTPQDRAAANDKVVKKNTMTGNKPAGGA